MDWEPTHTRTHLKEKQILWICLPVCGFPATGLFMSITVHIREPVKVGYQVEVSRECDQPIPPESLVAQTSASD
ncbi:hypothetical protein BDM02DRAFT_3119448, partial [Thelephora ganbajun]